MWKKTIYYTNYSAQYLVFPATFGVISRKIDYLSDSAPPTPPPPHPSEFLSCGQQEEEEEEEPEQKATRDCGHRSGTIVMTYVCHGGVEALPLKG